MKLYLWLFFTTFLISILGLSLVLFKIHIKEFPLLAPILFYFFFFLLNFSFFTFVGYITRRIFLRSINKFISYSLSLRQGFLLAIFACASVYLFYIKALTWWVAFIVLIVLFFTEVFFTIKDEVK